jgi:hypothetical protein
MREIKNLEDWWEKEPVKRKEIKDTSNNIRNTNNFKSPIAIRRSQSNKPAKESNKYSQIKKYTLNGKQYYNMAELLIFIKLAFGIDYENYLLKVLCILILGRKPAGI